MAWTIDDFALTDQRWGTGHRVSVGRPIRDDPTRPTPVIVCLDAPWVFGTMLDATRVMSMSGEAPEALVVGLAFDEDSMGEYLRQRARWFTPTPFVPQTEVGVENLEASECGRASGLHDFIREQLLPEVGRDRPLGERWLVGHSLSALFGLRTLLHEPGLFDKWLLASPSIWWDDRAILADEAEQAASGASLDAEVFISAGEDESSGPFHIVANAAELADRLRAREDSGLRVTSAVLPGDGHSNCIGAAVSKGLRALHRPEG